TAHASIDGPAIEGTFDAPKATPDMIAALAPGSKPTADVSLHADLRGRLPRVEASARLTAGPGTVDLRALVVAEEEKTVHAKIEACKIDTRALAAAAPSTDLGADVTIDVRSRPNGNADG